MSKIDQIYLRTVMLCMSKMSKIDQIHLRAVMLCMLKMSKIDQVHPRAVMLFMSETSEIVIIFNIHRAFQPYHPKSQLSKTFCRLKIH